MSVSDADPAVLFGGTWERFAKGRTLVGVDESSGEDWVKTVEKQEGEYKHKLTVSEMPSHSHSIRQSDPNGTTQGWWMGTSNYKDQWVGSKISNTGGDGAHNNVQPSITVYMWKRIA